MNAFINSSLLTAPSCQLFLFLSLMVLFLVLKVCTAQVTNNDDLHRYTYLVSKS